MRQDEERSFNMGEAYSIFGMALLLPFYMITTSQCFISQGDYSKLGRMVRYVLSVLVSPLGFYLLWQQVQNLILELFQRYYDMPNLDSGSNFISFISGFATFGVLLILFGVIYKVIIQQNSKIAFFVYISFMLILMGTKYLMIYKVNIGITVLTCVVLPTILYSLYYSIIDSRMRNMVKNADPEMLSSINLIPILAIIIIYISSYFKDSVMNIAPEDEATNFNGLSFMVGVLLLMLVFLAYNMIFTNINKTVQVLSLTKDVQEAQENVIIAFAEITETKSGQTGKHIHRVAEYSKVLAKALRFEDEDVENLRVAAMMHDIGKLMIPPEILEKKGRLTDMEYEIMKKHVVYGESILHNAPGKIMEYARIVALEHHERWDGKGYLGISGNNIHQISRIVSVADVFDALVSSRSYKAGWSLEKAKALIVENSGTQFDPVVVDAFVKHFDEIIDVYDAFPEVADENDVNHQVMEGTISMRMDLR